MENKTINIAIQGNVENLQTGENSKQIINKNNISYNFQQIESIKKDIHAFINELEILKNKQEIQENINSVFVELLEALSKVDVTSLEDNPEKTKTFIQKIYDNGKWLNDWKNITILPYEILIKGSNIIESVKPIVKPLLNFLQ